MRFRRYSSLIALTASLAVVPHAAPTPPDLLLILPVDTARVVLDSTTSTAALGPETPARASRKSTPSPAALVARVVFPVFGAAVTRMTSAGDGAGGMMGGLEAIDSSASRMAVTDVDADSARYRLVIDTLRVTQSTRTVARRTVPPTPPAYDPTTGMMTPGVRRAITEGPGRVTTLTLNAAWSILDRAAGRGVDRTAEGDANPILARGTATGRADFRGGMADARRADWEAAARALALDLTRTPPFTTPKAGP